MSTGRTARLQIEHTSELDPGTLEAARALLDAVFEGELTAEDWEHCLGGVHALVWDGDELVGHASVIQRRLLHGGRALRAGYVEGVGVRADQRRRGHAASMMTALERIVRAAYDLGALGATDEAVPFYRGRGWLQWEGRASVLTPDGLRRTPDDEDGIWVLPGTAPLDLSGELTCGWRDGDVW
jgi:aminoglycoside 2'-N-acetyltransferase I